MSNKIKWISQTAVMTALLLVLQFLTKPLGQIVTGSCVNAVLAVSCLIAGLGCGLTVAVISPLFAFMLGIGPKLFPVTPAIALGNCVLVVVLYLTTKKLPTNKRLVFACISASFLKFLTLNFLIVQIICRILELSEKQVTMFSAMFSWPQFITAIIGTSAALLISKRIKKARI